MTNFVKQKGMSYLLCKKLVDCTDEEKEYKRAYARHIKQMMVKRNPEKYHKYNSEYGKQYYQLHKNDLQEKAKLRIKAVRNSVGYKGRGRPNTLGIDPLGLQRNITVS
jgi:hypothetical protein